jgi:hypothetical protein
MNDCFRVVTDRVLHVGVPGSGPDAKSFVYHWDPRGTPKASFIATYLTRIFAWLDEVGPDHDTAIQEVSNFLCAMTYMAKNNAKRHFAILKKLTAFDRSHAPSFTEWGAWTLNVIAGELYRPIGPFYDEDDTATAAEESPLTLKARFPLTEQKIERVSGAIATDRVLYVCEYVSKQNTYIFRWDPAGAAYASRIAQFLAHFSGGEDFSREEGSSYTSFLLAMAAMGSGDVIQYRKTLEKSTFPRGRSIPQPIAAIWGTWSLEHCSRRDCPATFFYLK